MTDRVVLVSQSPKDIQFVLAIIDQAPRYTRFDLFVTSKACFDFLENANFLEKQVQIFDYSAPTPSSRLSSILQSVFVNRYRLFCLEKTFNSHCLPNRVYFFSRYFDVVGLTFYLRNRHIVDFQFIDIFGIDSPLERSGSHCNFSKFIYGKLVALLYSNELLFGVENRSMVGIEISDSESLRLSLSRKLDNKTFRSNLLYPAKDKKSILLFDSDYSYLGCEEDCAALLKEILSPLIARGYRVFIKEHPRLGGSDIANELVDAIVLDEKAPAELLDRSSFSLILAISTAALESYCDELVAFSLIGLLEKKVGQTFPVQVRQMSSLKGVRIVHDMSFFDEHYV